METTEKYTMIESSTPFVLQSSSVKRKIMKRMLPAAIILVLLVSCTKRDDNPNAVNQTDKDFMLQTYFTNKILIQSGKLALNQSNNSSIKYFSQSIVRQSEFAQTDLIAVANKINFNLSDTSKNNPLPANATSEYSDAVYIKNNAAVLQSFLLVFQKELNEGNNTYLRYYYLNKYVGGIKEFYLFADSLSRKL